MVSSRYWVKMVWGASGSTFNSLACRHHSLARFIFSSMLRSSFTLSGEHTYTIFMSVIPLIFVSRETALSRYIKKQIIYDICLVSISFFKQPINQNRFRKVFVWNGLFRSLTNYPNLLALSMI